MKAKPKETGYTASTTVLTLPHSGFSFIRMVSKRNQFASRTRVLIMKEKLTIEVIYCGSKTPPIIDSSKLYTKEISYLRKFIGAGDGHA